MVWEMRTKNRDAGVIDNGWYQEIGVQPGVVCVWCNIGHQYASNNHNLRDLQEQT